MMINAIIKTHLSNALLKFKNSQLSLLLFILLGTTLSAQPLNNHLQFDGINDYISLNNMDVSGSQITLEALINSSNLDNCANDQCRIISKALSPTPADHYWMLSTTTDGGNTVLRFRVKTNGTTTSQVATLGALSENTWYHVAATYDGSAMKLFLNGAEVGNIAASGTLTTNPSVNAWIGGNPPTDTGHPWQGGIDEVRIWNTARTQAQLQANRNTELTGNESGLQAYYQFNEGTGQTIIDQTGNNNTVLGSTNGSDTNDPTFANSNPNPMVTFNLQVFLEGAYDPGQTAMTGDLLQRAIVPQGQPYTVSPWNYPGTEGSGWLPVDYPAETVDWVLITLRESLAPESEVARVAAVLLKNGTISPFDVDLNNSTNPLYVMIEHRNHLPIISAQPIPIVNNTLSYDFTTQNSYNPTGFGQKQVGANWMMYGGNSDQEGANSCDINAGDRAFWEMVNGLFDVYNPGDYNLDGDVNGADRIVFNYNNGIFTTIPKSTNPDVVLNCPASGFILDTCSLTFSWTHLNPASTIVNYDLRINGKDPGQSVTYPATSNTVDICNLLGITSGTGTFDVELVYWYDGDFTTVDTTDLCTINYDITGSSTHGQGKTFAQIAADAHSNFCASGDESYVAEYLFQHPTVCFWEVQTINGVKCVVPKPDPVPPANTTILPPPSGGDDTNMLNNALNGGGSFDGLNRTYRISRLTHTAANMQLFNITLKPVAGATTLIYVDAPGILHYNVNIDGENQASIYQCIRLLDTADDYIGVKGSAINTWHKKGAPGADNLSGGVYRIAFAENFHIAGNRWVDHRNDVEQKHDVNLPTVASCRAVWMVGGNNGLVPSGIIANNFCENLQSNGNREDAEFFVVQGYTGAAPVGTVKVYANRGEDAGKRLTKCQDGGVAVYSNSYWWKTLQGDLTSEDERQMRTAIAVHLGVSNVHFENNRIRVSQPRYAHICVWTDRASGPHSDNLTFNCNEVLFEVPHNNGNSGGGEIFFFSNITPSSTTGSEPTNSSISNNRFIDAGGDVKRYYWLRYGYVNTMPWPGLTFTGNVEDVPFTVSRLKF